MINRLHKIVTFAADIKDITVEGYIIFSMEEYILWVGRVEDYFKDNSEATFKVGQGRRFTEKEYWNHIEVGDISIREAKLLGDLLGYQYGLFFDASGSY